MERRHVIKTLAVGIGGLVTLPAWANGWTAAIVQSSPSVLTAFEADILAEIVETIIPKTDIVGAKDLKVHDFIQKMIADCYDLPVQTNFKNGLKTLDDSAMDSYAKPFAVCDKTQRETLLNNLATATDASQKDFFALVKNLTIQGFTSSEFVMTTFLKYKMVPGHYYGCVPVE